MANQPADNQDSSDLAQPRSIRVSDANWLRWKERARERGLAISSWLHMLAADDIRKGSREKPKPRKRSR
jgi:hypothetical protein